MADLLGFRRFQLLGNSESLGVMPNVTLLGREVTLQFDGNDGVDGMSNLDAELERANAAHDAWIATQTWHASSAVEKIRLQMLVRQTVALERIAAALERSDEQAPAQGSIGDLLRDVPVGSSPLLDAAANTSQAEQNRLEDIHMRLGLPRSYNPLDPAAC